MINVFLEVWLLFILSSAISASTMTVIIRTRQSSSERQRQSLLDLTYRQFEFVFKIVSSEGDSFQIYQKFAVESLILFILSKEAPPHRN